MQAGLVAVLAEPCIEVASHAPVRKGIGAVGRDVDLDDVVALNVVVLGCRRSHHSVVGQHDDSVVAVSNANLVLGTNHAQALVAAKLGTLDLELLVAIVEHAAHIGNNHLLASLHVGCSADNLLRSLSLAQVDSGQMQMRVGDVLAGQHLTNIEPFQATADALHLFHAANFKSYRRQGSSHFLWGEVKVDVFFQPLIRNIHNANLFTLVAISACKSTKKN